MSTKLFNDREEKCTSRYTTFVTAYRANGSSSYGIMMAISSGGTGGSPIIHGLRRDENNSVIEQGLVEFIGFCSLCTLCPSISALGTKIYEYLKSVALDKHVWNFLSSSVKLND